MPTDTSMGIFKAEHMLRSVISPAVSLYPCLLKAWHFTYMESMSKFPAQSSHTNSMQNGLLSEQLPSRSEVSYPVFPNVLLVCSQHCCHYQCQVNHDIIILPRLNPQPTADNGNHPLPFCRLQHCCSRTEQDTVSALRGVQQPSTQPGSHSTSPGLGTHSALPAAAASAHFPKQHLTGCSTQPGTAAG